MTQMYDAKGAITPVTVVSVLPNVVTQVRTKDTDGYVAVQMGMGAKKKLSKALEGHLKGLGKLRWVREFRMEGDALKEIQRGDKIDASIFTEGDTVHVTATSKGKGFAGVVKRHHFRGGPASHGHPHNHRAPGSIGCRFPQHTHKGKRMAGHMGVDTVTVQNLRIAKIDTENQLLAITGAIPGARGTLVKIVGK